LCGSGFSDHFFKTKSAEKNLLKKAEIAGQFQLPLGSGIFNRDYEVLVMEATIG